MAKRKTTEEFVQQAKRVHGDRYNYSQVQYQASYTKVSIECKEHGLFEQQPGHHISGSGCPTCGSKKAGESNKKGLEKFLIDAEVAHGNKYDYSKVVYINSKTKIVIICRHHGEFKQSPHNHTSIKHGCRKCSGTSPLSQEEFLRRSNQKHDNFYDYSNTIYKSMKDKVIIICRESGHGEFKQQANNHMNGAGCPKCARTLPKTLSDYQNIAQLRGFIFLETVCPSKASTPCRWKCANNHEWFASFSNVAGKNETGCPICSHIQLGINSRYGVDEYTKLAKLRNIQFIDEVPNSSKLKVNWKCSTGHIFKTSYSILNSGSVQGYFDTEGCSFCSKYSKATLEDYNNLAEDRNLVFCDQTIPDNSHIPCLWECKQNKHKIYRTYYELTRRAGCPDCYGGYKKTKFDYDELEKLTSFKRKDQINIPESSMDKEIWICLNNHEFTSYYTKVKSGVGCPYCSRFRSEETVRSIFEGEFKTSFQKQRLVWLNGLELDGYNEDLRLAFEYNGIQHYQYNNFFHKKDTTNFEKQQERDKQKLELCKQQNVDLIIIPYTFSYKQKDILMDYLSKVVLMIPRFSDQLLFRT